MLPALYGTGKAQNGSLDAFEIEGLKRFCESFEITAEGIWSFRADICTLDVIQLFDGELLDLLTTNFRTLMDLKYFHYGTFSLDVPLSPPTLSWVNFSPEVIGMCSALGIGIEVHSDAT